MFITEDPIQGKHGKVIDAGSCDTAYEEIDVKEEEDAQGVRRQETG